MPSIGGCSDSTTVTVSPVGPPNPANRLSIGTPRAKIKLEPRDGVRMLNFQVKRRPLVTAVSQAASTQTKGILPDVKRVKKRKEADLVANQDAGSQLRANRPEKKAKPEVKPPRDLNADMTVVLQLRGERFLFSRACLAKESSWFRGQFEAHARKTITVTEEGREILNLDHKFTIETNHASRDLQCLLDILDNPM